MLKKDLFNRDLLNGNSMVGDEGDRKRLIVALAE